MPRVNTKYFKLAIITMWGSAVFSLALSSALEPTLPTVLVDYIASVAEAEAKAPYTSVDAVWLMLESALVLLLVVSSIRLFRLQISGRAMFLFASLLGVAQIPLLGPFVTAPLTAVLDSVSALAQGSIIAMSYTANVFEREAQR